MNVVNKIHDETTQNLLGIVNLERQKKKKRDNIANMVNESERWKVLDLKCDNKNKYLNDHCIFICFEQREKKTHNKTVRIVVKTIILTQTIHLIKTYEYFIIFKMTSACSLFFFLYSLFHKNIIFYFKL